MAKDEILIKEINEQVDFKTVKEEWNEYALSDGTILKVKVVLVGVVRLNQNDPMTGNPIYSISHNLVVSANSPNKLKRFIPNKDIKDPNLR